MLFRSRKKRSGYFSNQGYELIGIEIPLYVQATEGNPNVIMSGFIDLVIRDIETDTIIIYDIKTSTAGWNAHAKKDKNKTSQLVLYKSYFAKQFGYDEEKINIEYFIVKRKLIEGFAYPQKRIQQFVPASGKPTRNKLIKDIEEFVRAGFNEDGTYNVNGNFPAVSNNGKNCKYCEFNKLYNNYDGYVCRATFFGGTKEQIEEIGKLYTQELSTAIYNNAIGTEEAIYTGLAIKYPELFNRINMINGDIKILLDSLRESNTCTKD